MFGFGKRRVEKLDFLVAGAQKSGTTALNYYLKRHPQIALPVKKELHFFDNDELFACMQSERSRVASPRPRRNRYGNFPMSTVVVTPNNWNAHSGYFHESNSSSSSMKPFERASVKRLRRFFAF